MCSTCERTLTQQKRDINLQIAYILDGIEEIFDELKAIRWELAHNKVPTLEPIFDPLKRIQN